MYGLRGCVVFRSTFDLEGRGKTCLTVMMEGIAAVGGPNFPQTAINIDGLGWSNNGGGWSIDILGAGALPELYPPDGEHQQAHAGKSRSLRIGYFYFAWCYFVY
jgi:hypothetical protein